MKKLELKCPRCKSPVQISKGAWDCLTQNAGWKYEPITFTCSCCGLSGKPVPSVRMAVQLWTMETKEEWDTYERTRQKAFAWLAKALREVMIHYYDYGDQKYREKLEKEIKDMEEELYTQILQCANELRIAAEKGYDDIFEETRRYEIYYDEHRIIDLLHLLMREYDKKVDNKTWLEVLNAPEIRKYNHELFARQAAKRTEQAWIRLERRKSTCPFCGNVLQGTERSDPKIRFCPACGTKLNR